MTKNKIPLLIILAVLVGAFFIFYPQLEQQFYGDDVVWQAEFGNIECLKHDVPITSEKYLDQQSLFLCDEFTLNCEFEVYRDRPTGAFGVGVSGVYRVCDLDGENCGSAQSYSSSSPTDIKSFTINKGQSVKFETGIFVIGESTTVINKKYFPFKLRKDERGQLTWLTPEGCTLPNNLRDDTPLQTVTIDGTTYSGGNRCLNIPQGEFCNYFIGFSPLFDDIYTYNGQEVVCQNQRLYKIKEVEFLDGTVRKFQDQSLTTVECCPDEPFCTENFVREEEEPERECESDVQCLNAGNPLPDSATSYIEYNCIDNQCVESDPIPVECTTTAQCILTKGENYVCDLNINNYGTCVLKPTEGEYCGDGICNELIGENTETCTQDCGIAPGAGISPEDVGECKPTKLGALTILPDFTGQTLQKKEVLGLDKLEFKIFGLSLGKVSFGEELAPCFSSWDAFVFIIAVLGTILVYFMFVTMFRKTSKTLPFVLGIIISIGVYLLILNYFEYGITLLILFLLIRWLANRYLPKRR